jgi:hypothetical protein
MCYYSFPQESMIMVLDGVYRDRNYARFFVLETIARVPYFGEGSVLSYACSSLKKVPTEFCSVGFCRAVVVPVFDYAWFGYEQRSYRCFTCMKPLAGGDKPII